MANCNSDKNVNKTFIIEPLELTAGTPTLTACTGVYTSKIISCSGDTSIEIYSGLTLNGYTLVNDTLSAVTIDASTIMSGGTNILEIVEASDTFVTGATYDTNNGILTISRNDGVDLTPSGFTSVISHTIPSGSTKTIAQNDMYLIWDDFTINSGSTLDNNGRLVVVNGDFNNFGSYSGSGSLELITTNLEYILNHGNETNGNLIFYTNSPSGWVSGDTISDISAATGNVLVTKEWVELATSVDNNDFTTGATLVDETIVFDRKDALSAYTVDISSVNSGDTFVTGGTLVNKELVLDRNDSLSAVTVDLSGLTNNAGAGLTYNPTTGKIDLGGSLEHNDASNIANNVYFTPAAAGANLICWGLDSSYNPSGNYIGRFDTFTFSGKHEIHGAFQSSGVNLGLYMSNTPSVSFRQYKDVTKILPSSSFPGPTSGMTYQEFDSPTQHQREIWESHDSNTRSRVNQLFNEFKWDVYNNVGGDNAASKTFFHIESERILGGVVNSGGTKFGIFQFAPTHIQFLDGDFKGVGTFPTSTYLGDLAKSNLIIENDSSDSTFKDATSNKRGVKYIGFGETNTETGVGANYSTLVGTSLVPKKYVDDYIASPSGNTFSTGGTYNDIADTITITRNDGDSFEISGITDYYTTGATLIGNIVYFDREDSLSAYTADLSSLDVNDTFVSGFTRSGNVLTIERNDGVDLPLDISDIVFSGGSGNCITDLYVTNINGCSPINVKDDLVIETKIVFSGTPLLDNTLTQLLVRDSSSGEVKYREANSVDTFVTGTTFSNNQLSIDLNNGTNVSALINNLSGLTVDGNVLVNGDVNIIGTATTINSEQVLIKDNIITLNSNVTGSTSPVLNAGFEVLRGSADTKSLLWLESSDMWSIDDDLSVSGYVSGTTYYGDGSNLTGIDDTFVTGGTYSGSTIILNRNDGNSVDVTGITSSNIYTADGTIGTGRVATLTDTLRFKDGTLQVEGSNTSSASSASQIYNSGPNLLWDFRNNGDLLPSQNVNILGSSSSVSSFTFCRPANPSGYGAGINIDLHNSSSAQATYARFASIIESNTAGSHTGRLELRVADGGTVTTKMTIKNDSTIISEKLELSTTTDGMLMPRLTTAQMNAISSPDTHLVIFNTDLNALYRYNGSAWVAMAAGYGLISIKDSVGNPTFYSDLQTAITATTSADTVTIHSEIKLTSTVNIPARNSLTINFQGNRIYGDTSGGDFNLFTITANSSASRRDLYFIGGGVLETIGTASNVVDAAPFHALNIGTDKLKLYAGTTQIRSVNADCFYTNGMGLINGGIFYSENKGGGFAGGSNILEYAKLDVYTRPTLPVLTRFCELTTRYQGFIVTQSSAITKCSIRGSVLQSGNYGLLYIYQGTDCTDNYLEQTDASGRDALYVRGSSGTDGQVSGNICINKGSAAAGNLVYGQAHNNYFYSESGYGLYVGANCKEVSNNKCFSNASSAKGALFSTAEITVDNYAENLNSSNGYPALVIANQAGQTHEAFGNRAIVANNSSSNIKLSGAGTYYLANNIMGKVGTGLDLNGETNSQINTPDDFGNIKIG